MQTLFISAWKHFLLPYDMLWGQFLFSSAFFGVAIILSRWLGGAYWGDSPWVKTSLALFQLLINGNHAATMTTIPTHQSIAFLYNALWPIQSGGLGGSIKLLKVKKQDWDFSSYPIGR